MAGARAYRTLSWLSVLGLGVFCTMVTIAPFGWRGVPVVALISMVLVLATLKLGVRQPVPYWETSPTHSQAPRVMALIAIGVIIHMLLGAAVQISQQMSVTPLLANAVSLLVWTLIPVAMLALGKVSWPKRVARPSMREVLPVAIVAVLVAIAMCSLGAAAYDGPRMAVPATELLLGGVVILLAATMEEVVYRVLLLTALVQASASRFHALTLSSVIFALVHVPGGIAGPVIAGDWVQAWAYSTALLGQLVFVVAAGFMLGALWLRTGSIILISAVHAIYNLGPLLVGGIEAI